jgi:hypothetical protein
MITAKTGPDHNEPILGLLACGRCGQWSLNVDETTSGPERWFLEIEGPAIYFSFEIPSVESIDQVLRFLRYPDRVSDREIGIGKNGLSPVRLITEDEIEHRVILMVGTEAAAGPVVRYTLSGADLRSVVTALEQVKSDLG